MDPADHETEEQPASPAQPLPPPEPARPRPEVDPWSTEGSESGA